MKTNLGMMLEGLEKPLLRFCLSLTKNVQLAEDVKQDTLVRIIEKLPTLRDPKNLRSWAFQIAKNLYLDIVRSPAVKRASPLEDDAELVSPFGTRERSEANIALGQVFRGLTPSEGRILVLVEMTGHSYGETAKVVGLSKNAVRSVLYRTRKKLVPSKADTALAS